MNQGKYLFAQIIVFIPKYQFDKCVKKYQGNYRVRSFTCWEQLLCLIFGHLTFRESLRDIIICLNAQGTRLYNMGFRSTVSRTTFSTANRKRNWRIYRDFAHHLMQVTNNLYSDVSEQSSSHGLKIYALDSTLIRMCISVFTWANYRKTTAGIKMHTLFEVNSAIPRFIYISDGRVNDQKVFKHLIIETKALYIMDRGYFNVDTLFQIQKSSAFFVLRVKRTINFRRQYSNSVEMYEHIKFDQIGVLNNSISRQKYPKSLRLIKIVDPEQESPIMLLTNKFDASPEEISELYKQRWKVELFFKWIKQHLKIKSLWGENENAVKTQMYSAIATYLLIAIIRKKLKVKFEMYQILQILSVTMMDKTPLNQVLKKSQVSENKNGDHNQLNIW